MTSFRFGILLFLVCLGTSATSQADSGRWLVIRDITLEGNKRTDDFVIHTSLTIKPGDSLQVTQLLPTLRENRILLEKTALFKNVLLETEAYHNDSITIHIVLKERWYYLLAPTLALGDRNFNVWWFQYNHDLGRLIFGATIALENLSGRADRMKFTTLFGFNHHYGVHYRNPYSSKSSNIGYEASYDFVRTRELAYSTTEDKLAFIRTNKFNNWSHRGMAGLIWRVSPFAQSKFQVIFHADKVADTVVQLNPAYLGDGTDSRKWFALKWTIVNDMTDHLIYPRSGTKWSLSAELQDPKHKGLNRLVIRPSALHYHALSSILSIGSHLRAQISAASIQPYFLQQALGYDPMLVRGYEYYVVDGQHFVLAQTDLKLQILKFDIPGSSIPLGAFREIPFEIYLRPHLDFGRVWDQKFTYLNELRNRWLVGGGIGLDVVSYYDYALSVNWSITESFENGLYLHVNF